MKKIFACFLAALLLASVGATAFADPPAPISTEVPVGENAGIPVTASYQSAPSPRETNYVYIDWKGMSFTYSPGYDGDWDPETLTHKADSAVKAGWTSSDDNKPYGTITLENRSEGETFLQASVAFKKDESFPSTYAYLRKSESADAVSTAATGDLTVQLPPLALEPSGTKNVYVVPYVPGITSFSDTITLGTITITISEMPGDPGYPGGGPEIFD